MRATKLHLAQNRKGVLKPERRSVEYRRRGLDFTRLRRGPSIRMKASDPGGEVEPTRVTGPIPGVLRVPWHSTVVTMQGHRALGAFNVRSGRGRGIGPDCSKRLNGGQDGSMGTKLNAQARRLRRLTSLRSTICCRSYGAEQRPRTDALGDVPFMLSIHSCYQPRAKGACFRGEVPGDA